MHNKILKVKIVKNVDFVILGECTALENCKGFWCVSFTEKWLSLREWKACNFGKL